MNTSPDLHLDESQIARKVTAERVRVFVDRSVAGAWSSPLGTLLLAWIQLSVVAWSTAVVWLCLINSIEFLIIVIGYRYRRSPPHDEDALHWAGPLFFANLLLGLAWGSSVWFFWADGHFTSHLLNLTVLVGVLGICVVTMSPFQMAMALFSAGVLLPPIVHIAFVDTPYGIQIATGLAFLFVLLLQYARVEGRELASGIESTVRNRALAERLDFALGAASDGLWDLDLRTGMAYLSPRYYEMTGFAPDEVTANVKFLRQLIHPEDVQQVTNALNAHLSGKTPQNVIEYRMITRNRSVLWVLGRGKVVERDAGGKPLRMVGTISDISDRKHMALSLEKESQRIQAILRTASDGIHILDQDGNVLEANEAFSAMLGYARDEILHLNASQWDELWSPHEGRTILKRLLDNAGPSILERRYRRKDGRIIFVEISVSPVELERRRLLCCSARDVTDRKHAEAALTASEERFRLAMEASNDGLWDWDIANDGGYFSPAYFRMLGYEPGEFPMTARSWAALIHPEDRERVVSINQDCIENRRQSFEIEYRMLAKSGGSKWILGRGRALQRDSQGRALRMIGTHVDITDRKRAEEEMRELATTDFLTGLVNRRCFLAKLEEELARYQRMIDQDIALLMLDLDHFKRVNDSYGHAVGDAMLKHFSALVAGELRRIDIAGRLGGEEFGIILPGADLDSAKVFAERICRKISTSPLRRDDQRLFFTVSIGVTVLRIADREAAVIVDRADRALYRAKELGRDRVEVDTGA